MIWETSNHLFTGTIPPLPPLTGGVLDLSHNKFQGDLPSFTRAPLQYGFDHNCQLLPPSTSTSILTPITYPYNLTTYTATQLAEMSEVVEFQLTPQGGGSCGTPSPLHLPTAGDNSPTITHLNSPLLNAPSMHPL